MISFPPSEVKRLKINTIELENFKTHVKSKVDFSRGLNLILGLNGAGKSTILQALGFAIAGIKWENNYRDFITNFNDSNYALVKVSFTAQDGLEYFITRKIEERRTTWELSSPDGMKWKTQSEVLNMIRHLTGIEGEIGEVYKSVITAHQNDMTSIFAETPSKRKAFFDGLFNTEIYKKLSQNELKAYLDEVEKEEIKLNTKMETLKESVEKLKGVEEMLKHTSDEFERIKEELLNISSLKARKEKTLEEIEKIYKELESLERKKEEETRRFEEKRESLMDLQERLKNSKKARDICEKSRNAHDEYEKIYKEIERDEEYVTLKEKEIDELKQKEKEISEMKKEIEKLGVALSSLEEKGRELSKEIKELEEKLRAKKMEEEEIIKEISDISSTIEKNFQLAEENKNLSRTVNELVDEVLKIESRKKEIQHNMQPFSKEKIEELEMKIEKLKEKEKELKSLNAKKYAIIEKINNLNDSESSLKNGICPILSEKCLNLEGKDVPLYFQEKREAFETELKLLKFKIEKTEKELSSMKTFEERLMQEKKNKEMFERDEKRVDELEIEKKKGIEKLKEVLGYSEDLSISDMPKIRKAIQEKIVESESKMSSLTGEKKEVEKRKHMLEKHVEELMETLKLKNESLSDVSRQQETHLRRMKELEKDILSISQTIKTLPDMEKELSTFKENLLKKREKIKMLKFSHDEYNRNFEKAKELENIEEMIRRVEGEKSTVESDLEKISSKLKEVSELYDEKEHEKIKSELKDIEKRMNEMNARMGQFRQMVEDLKNKSKDLKEKREKIGEIEKSLSVLNKKRKFIAELRKMFNGMGSEVAQRYRNYISSKATLKYQSLTNKMDIIKWESDYDVHLITPMGNRSSDRNFPQLSGGEQMIVALSIRAALNEVFSHSRFVIFDEPTISLDEERRRALSEYLPKLFENMEQVIIITHDETFREMAERVIFIEKEGEISVVK